MNFSTLADEDEDDEKVIPKTASGGRGQKSGLKLNHRWLGGQKIVKIA